MITPDKFAEFVGVGNFTEGERDAKFLAALGLSGEAAEIVELILDGDQAALELCAKTGKVSERVKKHLLHGKELDRGELRKELGDVLWYLFHAFNVFGFTFQEVAEQNVVKLCNRYPTQYGIPKDWNAGEMTLEEATGIAAHAWGDPQNSHKDMDPELAKSFALRLMYHANKKS